MLANHKRSFGFILKVAIVLLAVIYIAKRFYSGAGIENIPERLLSAIQKSPLLFILVLLLMPLNWLLEGLKWKITAGQQMNMSFADAMRGVLAGVTIGTATPNRIGEFAGRIFMGRAEDRVPLLFLSFVCSFCQVVVTFLAGIMGLYLLENNSVLSKTETQFVYFSGLIFCLLPLTLFILPPKLKAKTDQLRKFPLRLFLLVFLLSLIRYSIYVIQFLLLLKLLDPDLFSVQTLAFITVSYLVVTLIPTFSFTEIFIRGSIAGIIFSTGGSGEEGFIAAVLLWMINVAIPSLVGTIFVFRLKIYARK
ncbi:hypothetical protein BH09BAC5_BH09BAC5_14420 [soil metagenome]